MSYAFVGTGGSLCILQSLWGRGIWRGSELKKLITDKTNPKPHARRKAR
jgi:hypothetical protein